MKHKVLFLALALTMALSSAALAGGSGECADKTAATKARAAKLAEKGYLGIETGKDEATGAWRVTKVAAGSPAEAAGFWAGDVLVSLNGVALKAENKEQIKKVKSSLGVGKSVTYTVARNGTQQTLRATLAPVPDQVLAQWVAEEEAAEKQATQMAAANN
ncbi:MAG TPA: PDZ domain-containing protein [Thermoanaerobaculia bacterium]|nr:PDZ domain-containing protein [Thermoanaerobaculia bacterium]